MCKERKSSLTERLWQNNNNANNIFEGVCVSSCVSFGSKCTGLKLTTVLEGRVPKAAVASTWHLNGSGAEVAVGSRRSEFKSWLAAAT